MKDFIFKFGIVSVVIVGGVLAVCAVAFPRFFASVQPPFVTPVGTQGFLLKFGRF